MNSNKQYNPYRTHGRNRKTRVAALEQVLRDGGWHSTFELVLRIGHTFAGAKFQLVKYGYQVERRKHPSRPRQWQYRLVSRELDQRGRD